MKVVDLDQECGPRETTIETHATFLVAMGYEGLKLFSQAEQNYSSCLDVAWGHEDLARSGVERMKETRSPPSPSLPLMSGTGTRGWSEGFEKGDWIGPVEIQNLPGREGGRGMIATRDIKAGEVLLGQSIVSCLSFVSPKLKSDSNLSYRNIVEKAFVWSAGDHFGARTRVNGHNLAVNSELSACSVGIVSSLIDRLRDDPSTVPLVEALYGGPTYPPTGSFSWSSIVSRPFDPNDDVASLNLDVSRLEHICSFNWLVHLHWSCSIIVNNSHGLVDSFSLTSYGEDDHSIHPSQRRADALFLLASIFNHQCVPNALHDFCRDVMIIRATAPIRQGEEVFVSYYPVTESKQSREDFFRPIFEGGKCPCEYCKLERSKESKNGA